MIRKIRSAVAELGISGALLYYVDQVSERFFSRRTVYFYDIYCQPVPKKRLRNRSAVRATILDSADQLMNIDVAVAPNRNLANSRLERGYKCLVVYKNSELVAYGWIAMDGYSEDEVRCNFHPLPAAKTGWDFDIYIPPEKRGSFAFVYIWDAINEYYRSKGRQFSFSRISRFNRQSVLSHKRMGARQVAWIVFFDLYFAQLSISSIQPRVSLVTKGQDGPTYRFLADDCVESLSRPMSETT